MSTPSWFVIYTGDSRQTERVKTIFKNLGRDSKVWVPMEKNLERSMHRTVAEFIPMFPGYIFVNFDIVGSNVEELIQEAKAGVFLKKPGNPQPAILSDDEIAQMREAELATQGVTDVVAELNIHKDDIVEIMNGPFIGAVGSVTGVTQNRVVVEIEIFGRTVSAQIDPFNCTVKTPQNG